jgi:glycerol kinase
MYLRRNTHALCRTGRRGVSPDLLDAPVDRPMIRETTALGAAYLAGLAAGVYPEPS